MPYCDFNDVMVRYPPLRTMVGTGDYQVTTNEVTSMYLPDGASLIDAMLATRYVVPITPSPQLLTMVNADLAIYRLLAEKLPSVPDFAQKRYDYSCDILKKLAEGKLQIQSAVVVLSGDQFAWSPGEGYHPVFSPVLDDVCQRADLDFIIAEKDERRDDI